jgi:hypothetical protein
LFVRNDEDILPICTQPLKRREDFSLVRYRPARIAKGERAGLTFCGLATKGALDLGDTIRQPVKKGGRIEAVYFLLLKCDNPTARQSGDLQTSHTSTSGVSHEAIGTGAGGSFRRKPGPLSYIVLLMFESPVARRLFGQQYFARGGFKRGPFGVLHAAGRRVPSHIHARYGSD